MAPGPTLSGFGTLRAAAMAFSSNQHTALSVSVSMTIAVAITGYCFVTIALKDFEPLGVTQSQWLTGTVLPVYASLTGVFPPGWALNIIARSALS